MGSEKCSFFHIPVASFNSIEGEGLSQQIFKSSKCCRELKEGRRITENQILESRINTGDSQESNFCVARGRSQIANVFKGNCWLEADGCSFFSGVRIEEKE